MGPFEAFIMGLLAVAVGFQFGRWATKYPSEIEMLQRLVTIRLERRLAKDTREQVAHEVEAEVNKRAAVK